MDPELVKQIRQWKAGMEVANRFDIEVARQRSPAERLLNHQRFLDGNARFGFEASRPEDRLHRMPFHEIQERWLAQHPEHHRND
jgi:hypothetical protein